jgi:hypothetical protein
MTPKRYAQVIGKLGLSQVGSAAFLDYDARTVRRWVRGDLVVPKAVAMLLELMVKIEAEPGQVEKLDHT